MGESSFWYRPTRVVPDQRPLNGRCCKDHIFRARKFSAFSALTLLVGWQEGHPACKNRVVGCLCGYLSGARCRLAYGPADATAIHCLLLQ